MRTQTDTYTIYNFSELSSEVQAEVLDRRRETNLDYEWWDSIDDYAREVAAVMGIEVEKIYFSGFYSQGDGAQFVGDYSYKKEAMKNLLEISTDKDLQEIAKGLQDIQRLNFYQLTASVGSIGNYSHEYCTSITVERDSDNDQEMTDDAEDKIEDLLRQFMGWIYFRLRDEYEYLQSDEQIKEGMEVDEQEFRENGEPI